MAAMVGPWHSRQARQRVKHGGARIQPGVGFEAGLVIGSQVGFEFFLLFKSIFRVGHINRLWKSGLTMMFRSINYFWLTLKMDSVVV